MHRLTASMVLLLGMLCAFPGESMAQLAPPSPNRPAATLLLPYFEVDLANAEGMTTLFSVNNASATAILGHVTVWSDLGVPVFAFNVYLTGYDVQTINLRDILTGTVPRTASAGQDPTRTISNQGPLSQDINFASCTGQLPPPALSATYVQHLQSSLTGGPSSLMGGQCLGRNLGTPSIARGYVTVDTVNNCTLRFPGDPGYFAGDVTFQNTLWGDYTFVDPSRQLAYGDPLVHIAADPTNPEVTTPGQYTFYGSLVNWSAVDRREPLSTTFAARFVGAKDYKQENKALLQQVLPPATELVVWRDTKAGPTPAFACGAPPAWYPLGQEQVRAFNEQESNEVLASATPFPAATQRVAVTSSALPTTFDSGWFYLNLNRSGTTGAPEDPLAAQAWVTLLHTVQQAPTGGRYDVGFRAVRLDSAQQASHLTIP